MNQYIKILLFSILLSCISIQMSVAESTLKQEYFDNPIEKRVFTNEVWKDAVGNIEYISQQEKIKREREERQARANSNSNNNNNNNRTRSSGGRDWSWNIGDATAAGFFKILLLILGIIAISFLIFKLAGGELNLTQKEKKKENSFIGNIDIEEIEQNIHKSDMELLLEKTITEGNYMMAVRIYYLWAIKELTNKRLIKWKRDKTNRDYIREIRKTNFHKPFREITRIFERIWYGNQNQLQKNDFAIIEPTLKEFINELKKS